MAEFLNRKVFCLRILDSLVSVTPFFCVPVFGNSFFFGKLFKWPRFLWKIHGKKQRKLDFISKCDPKKSGPLWKNVLRVRKAARSKIIARNCSSCNVPIWHILTRPDLKLFQPVSLSISFSLWNFWSLLLLFVTPNEGKTLLWHRIQSEPIGTTKIDFDILQNSPWNLIQLKRSEMINPKKESFVICI